MAQNQLHAEKHEILLSSRGRIVEWREAMVCSCWNLDSGQPDYSCPACLGLGYIYADPVRDIVGLTSITHSNVVEDMAGLFEIGDAIMTVGRRVFKNIIKPPNRSGIGNWIYDHDNPIYDVGQFDLITLTDDVYKSSEILQKGVPIHGTGRPADTLINEDIVEIRKVRMTDVREGKVYEYEEGKDYVLDGNRIQWLDGGNQPPEGAQYSVMYTHRPTFTVLTQLPMQRHQDGQDLPKRVVLRQRAWGVGQRPNQTTEGLIIR